MLMGEGCLKVHLPYLATPFSTAVVVKSANKAATALLRQKRGENKARDMAAVEEEAKAREEAMEAEAAEAARVMTKQVEWFKAELEELWGHVQEPVADREAVLAEMVPPGQQGSYTQVHLDWLQRETQALREQLAAMGTPHQQLPLPPL